MPGIFFEARLGLAVGLGMDRARLLPGQAEVVEQPEHAVLRIADAEAGFHEPTEVLGAPGADAIAFRVRAAQHQRLERRQLTIVEPGRAAALGPITQTLDPFGIKADHPVPERLAVHARLARRVLAAHAVEHVGQGEQPARYPAVGLLAGQAAQLAGRDVGTDRYCRGHLSTSLHHHAAR
jgi:hypothetical protein